MNDLDLLPAGLRRATPAETSDWLAGYFPTSVGEQSYETEEGLLVPAATCQCGDEVFYDGTFNAASHRRCHLIP